MHSVANPGKCFSPCEVAAALEHKGDRRRLGPLMPGERPRTSASVWEVHFSLVLRALSGLLLGELCDDFATEVS